MNDDFWPTILGFFGLLGFFAACGAFIYAVFIGLRTDPSVSKAESRAVVIDGCQYLETSVHGGYALAHKGNCTNAIHAHNQ